jgi:hypothetical protein
VVKGRAHRRIPGDDELVKPMPEVEELGRSPDLEAEWNVGGRGTRGGGCRWRRGRGECGSRDEIRGG